MFVQLNMRHYAFIYFNFFFNFPQIQQSTSSPSTTGAKSGQQKMSILSKISGPIAQALAPTVIDVGAENKRDRIKSIEHEQRNKRLSSGPLTRLTKITPVRTSIDHITRRNFLKSHLF